MPADAAVRYADSGGLQIAYRVIGEGPLDVVIAFEWASNLDLFWENPQVERYLRRFTNYGRLIHFDMRGLGLSDPVESLPPLEDWVDDVGAVMAAAGSERAALVGQGHAGQLCLLFAALHPERTTALVTVNSYARLRRAPDYPAGLPPAAEETVLRGIEAMWGSGAALAAINPTTTRDAWGRSWGAKLERAAGSPGRAVRAMKLVSDIDIRDILPSVKVPTLVIHSRGNNLYRPDHGRYLADHIPGARYLEIEGDDHTPMSEELMDAIEQFLTGTRNARPSDRVLMTVAFTDIVGSTEIAADLGDRRWRNLLEVQESVARREIEAVRGRLVKSTGDGLMATFDGPARAVQCMRSIGRLLEPLGLRIRSGVHTGEVELMGEDIGGIAVHVAARLADLAGPGEILASSTVRDLVAGSGLVFEDRGEQSLKGVPEPWRVFAAG
ncbi:MAG: alpha/beta fold hydrolase [Actinomycetota bacterium]